MSAGSTKPSLPRNARSAAVGEVRAVTVDLLRLAQLLAAPHPHLAAQRCGDLVISPQLLPLHLRQRPQLAAGDAEVHGDARIEHVAQLAEDDARLVAAELRERHPRDSGDRMTDPIPKGL